MSAQNSRSVRGEGIVQQQTERGAQAGEARLDEAVRVARLSGEHVWVVIVTHLVTDPGAPEQLLDLKSMVGAYMGCYVCEQPWTERQRHRRCPGEPS